MLRRRSQAGFTLVEMLVVITIIGILAGLALPNITKARTKAKESEVKANLHSIQTSLERFYVDHQQYPAYIAGGNAAAWAIYKRRMTAQDPTHADLNDPLVIGAYIDTYPRNPFVTEGSAVVTETGGDANTPGSGDPRFGQNGVTVGNIMDDSRFYNTTTTPNEPLKQFAYSREGLNTDLTDTAYPAGGKLNPNNLVNGQPSLARNWWPGNFFYRAVGPVDWVSKHPNFDTESPKEPWAYYVARYDSYYLGAYGDKTTDGKDVVRTTPAANGNLYRQPPTTAGTVYPTVSLDNGSGTTTGLPEVMGGGDKDNNPYFPYLKVGLDSSGNPQVSPGEYQYGAPDGVSDGVVQVLAPASDGASTF
ncbi:MAG: type II secretion system protein [bacterium]